MITHMAVKKTSKNQENLRGLVITLLKWHRMVLKPFLLKYSRLPQIRFYMVMLNKRVS